MLLIHPQFYPITAVKLCNCFKVTIDLMVKPVEAAEGKTTHNNVWNGANGMESNMENLLDVFGTIPPVLLQPLPRVRSPQLMCHQPPVGEIAGQCFSSPAAEL